MKRIFSLLLGLLFALLAAANPQQPVLVTPGAPIDFSAAGRIGDYDAARLPWENAQAPPDLLALSTTIRTSPNWVFFNPAMSFQASLQTTLVPEHSQGSGTPTFTRATTAYQQDFEGKLNLVLSGEARFQGARRVYNLIPAAGTGSASLAVAANKTVTVGVGVFVFSMGAEATGTGVITFTGTATGSSGTLTADATNRTAATLTITVGGTIIMTATEQAATNLQLENVTGQANQNPSEYVSVGVLSAPFHGAGVDGVKYFSTLNGNTVASNVVTEATGAAINSSTSKFGVLPGSGTGFTTPSATANQITGDIEFVFYYAAQDWTPAAETSIVGKWGGGGARAYLVTLATSGKLNLYMTTDGTTSSSLLSSVATGLTDGTGSWVKIGRVQSTGNVTYSLSQDGVTWTTLGTVTALSAGNAIASTTGNLELGSDSGGSDPATGRLYRVKLYNGINGTLAVDFNPNLSTSAQTFTAATGEVWTTNGTARIYGNTDNTYGIPAQWDAGGPFGYLAEGARADVLGVTTAIRRTMTDVGWVNGGTMTVGAATGTDGVASAAASLTGGAVTATNTILFTTVLGAAVRTYSALVRRKTGTGAVSITGDGGVTWTPMTLTTAYKQFSFVTASAANPVVGFKIDTNTDAIEVDFNTIEAATFANPTPIPVNVSKAADVLTYPMAGNVDATKGTGYGEFTVGFNVAAPQDSIILAIADTSGLVGYQPNAAGSTQINAYDGTNGPNLSSTDAYNSVKKFATTWGNAGFTIAEAAGSNTTAFAGNMGAGGSTKIGIGVDPAAGGNQLNGTIRNVRFYLSQMSLSQQQTIVAFNEAFMPYRVAWAEAANDDEYLRRANSR